MNPLRSLALLAALGLVSSLKPAWSADLDPPKKVVEPAIDKALQWLAQKQLPNGSWEADDHQYPVAMTAFAGLALLAEGSTPSEGKYAKELDKAVTFLLGCAQPNGAILFFPPKDEKAPKPRFPPVDPRMDQHYLFGHGYATLFLSQVYSLDAKSKRRPDMEKALKASVLFLGKAQAKSGGWGYVSAAESPGFDEAAATLTVIQALQAAQKAGIAVPKEVLANASEYVKQCTVVTAKDAEASKQAAGVIYSLLAKSPSADARAPLTAAAAACWCTAGDFKSPLTIQWINFCRDGVPADIRRVAHAEYLHFYFAQVMYALGEERDGQMRPDLRAEEQLKWSRYRKALFDLLIQQQENDGSWKPSTVGPVYSTAIYALLLQLDRARLPVFQREAKK
jgi:hypothetical protein